ncbi:hypothetical protein [Nocardia sp. NBC_00511]|uniref:DUF7373 family lipoprotein n=1 Tax=Nocardia sp. NBC_00511 TaxID=2903591 RepID=UPI0030E5A738
MRRSDPTNRYDRAGLLPVLSVATLLTACTVAGSPQAAPPRLGRLDLDGYSGRALAEPAAAGETYGALMESVRMADALVSPLAIDPGLTHIAAVPVPTPADAVGILADVTVPTLTAHGMLAGFSIGGTDDPTGTPHIGTARSVRITVLRVRDNTAAIDAAHDIDSVDYDYNRDNVAVRFSEYFATHGHWRPLVPTFAATLAHGPYVVTLFITDPTTDRATLRDLATTAFDAELPRLDAFAPTPAEGLPALPLDPDGLLSRLVPAEAGKWPYPRVFRDDDAHIAGWGGQRGADGIVYGPLLAQVWLDRPEQDLIPVEAMAVSGSARLLRFADPVAARKALRRLTERDADGSAVESPAGVPDTVCRHESETDPQAGEDGYRCLVLEGRYLALVPAATAPDVRRKAAAQYEVLATDQ